ncbi:MAG: DUF6447 family protein [Massilia sp.]|uniref:hypothetical protein n=1 Tax=Massilia sp. TaxID=1882437 RepID=UPI002FCB910B
MHLTVNPRPSPLEGKQTERLCPANWLKKCLPNEPSILHPVAQASLTAHYLLPVLSSLESCLLAVRHRLDNELERRQPVKLGKAYPLGQCLEIAEAVQQCLRTVAEADLPAESVVGLRALRAFQRAGGDFRQVWGDLRGEYFQNAYQVGTLYIDVANDTVNPAKPKVEILPFCEAQFVPIRDFQHFRKIARSYWQHEVYPNHILPALAPHCPLIHVSKNGIVKLHDATQYMLAMTRTQGFAPSERALREPPMPQALFEQLRQALQGAGHTMATSPEQGRTQGLQQCREQRAKRWALDSKRVTSVIQDANQINLHLASWRRRLFTQEPPAQSKIMSTIQIDNNTYELDSLSDDAKAQLQSIRFVDQELARLQAQVAAMQTARIAYLNALKAVLPVV